MPRRRLSIAAAVAALVVVGCSESATGPTSVRADTPPAATTTSPLIATTTEPPRGATSGPQTTATIPPDSTTATTVGIIEVSVTGVVIDVVGGLAGIDSFTLRLSDGTDLALTPGEGLLFDDGVPISHLRDHLISGAPVTATYLETSRGRPVVVAVGDADGGHSHDD